MAADYTLRERHLVAIATLLVSVPDTPVRRAEKGMHPRNYTYGNRFGTRILRQYLANAAEQPCTSPVECNALAFLHAAYTKHEILAVIKGK